jgi:PAS domain S-box-containing protein
MLSQPEPTNIEKHVMDKITMMCKTDENRIIEYANDYFVELSGYTVGEFIGESLFLIKHPDMPRVIDNYVWNQLKNQKTTHCVYKYINKDGQFYWLQIRFDFKVNELNSTIQNVYLYAEKPNKNKMDELDKFYKKLTKIEQEAEIKVAENYFNGMLEEKQITFEEFMNNYI